MQIVEERRWLGGGGHVARKTDASFLVEHLGERNFAALVAFRKRFAEPSQACTSRRVASELREDVEHALHLA